MGSDRSSRAEDTERGGVEVARGASSSPVGRSRLCVTHREADRRRERRHTLSGRFIPFLSFFTHRSRRRREASRPSRASSPGGNSVAREPSRKVEGAPELQRRRTPLSNLTSPLCRHVVTPDSSTTSKITSLLVQPVAGVTSHD